MNRNNFDQNSQTKLQDEVSDVSIVDNHDMPKKEIVIIFQLVVCIMIAVVLFVVKCVGGSVYEDIRKYFYTNINNSVITEFISTDEEGVSYTINDEN